MIAEYTGSVPRSVSEIYGVKSLKAANDHDRL
jgi:hypothetical protein